MPTCVLSPHGAEIQKSFDSSIVKIEDIHYFISKIVPTQKFPHPLHYRSALKLSKSIRKFKPSICHLVGPDPFHYLAAIICKIHKLKTVVSYHTDLVTYAKYHNVTPWLARISQFIYWKKSQKSKPLCFNKLITTSESFKDNLIKNNIACTDAIPIAINQTIFNNKIPFNKDLRHRITNQQPSKITVITVCRFAKEKNIPELIDACSQLTNITLVLIGDGPDKSWYKKARKHGYYISDRFLSQNEVAIMYNHADIFMSCSTTETLVRSTLQAQACGLPCIIPQSYGGIDIVRDQYNGLLFNPNDLFSAKEALIKLSNDHELRKKYSNNAIEYSKNKGYLKSSKWLIETYNSVLAE